MYSQKQGSLYKGPFDCIVKIAKSEGIHGFYKVMTFSSFKE